MNTERRLSKLESDTASDHSRLDKHEERISRIERLIDKVLRWAGLAAATILSAANLRQSGLETALRKLIALATQ